MTSGEIGQSRVCAPSCTRANVVATIYGPIFSSASFLSIWSLFFSIRRITGVFKFCMGITSAQRLILSFENGAEKKRYNSQEVR